MPYSRPVKESKKATSVRTVSILVGAAILSRSTEWGCVDRPDSSSGFVRRGYFVWQWGRILQRQQPQHRRRREHCFRLQRLDQIARIVKVGGGLLTQFQNNAVYLSPNGQNLAEVDRR